MSRPLVTLCYTQTIDGRLATRTGSSQWIGGDESVVFAHRLRAEHDAIMVGVGTLLKDDPRLTVRHITGRDPLRVVVDSTLRTPLEARVLAGDAARGTLVVTTDRASDGRRAAIERAGARVLTIDRDAQGRVDLAALLRALADRGVASVMVEGGAALITALLRDRLADRVAICVAPKIMGAGIEAIGDLGVAELPALLTLHDTEVLRYGVDLIITGGIAYPDAAEAHHG